MKKLDDQRVVSLSKSTQGKVNNRDTLIAFISDHNQLAEHLSMNYKEMTPEDLGAILESISQALTICMIWLLKVSYSLNRHSEGFPSFLSFLPIVLGCLSFKEKEC
ncbi:phage protein [Streptococcus pyogenes]|nr:phage protein [Streptococcus pyogenes]